MTNLDSETVLSLASQMRGDEDRVICPCARDRRREHQSERTLSLRRISDGDGERIVYNCWHCEAKGAARLPSPAAQGVAFLDSSRKLAVIPRVKEAPIVEVSYPSVDSLPGLTSDAAAWLLGRCISSETAHKASLYSVQWDDIAKCYVPWKPGGWAIPNGVAFPYIDERGRIYAAKYRSIREKRFQSSGRDAGFYLSHLIEPDDTRLVIVEGEIDALSLLHAGVGNVVSVPYGASSTSERLSCVAGLSTYLRSCRRIVLATDSDGPGLKLRSELARRLGKARCWTLEWPEGIKDANDFLRERGPEALCAYVDTAAPMPVEGLFEARAFGERLKALYNGEVGRGLSTGIADLDDFFTVPFGHLSIVTGYPNNGKSTFVDAVICNLARDHGVRTAIWSAENTPEIHIAKLIENHVGVPFFSDLGDRMSSDQADEALKWVNDHFVFLAEHDEVESTIDSILERIEAAVQRYGVRCAVIDPYNHIAKPLKGGDDGAETEWIRRTLIKVKKFAQSHELHIFLVAHPRMKSQSLSANHVPKGDAVAGSAAWAAVCDFGLTIHRNDENGASECHIWKCRFKWHGKRGVVELGYNPISGRFHSLYEWQRPARGERAASSWDF